MRRGLTYLVVLLVLQLALALLLFMRRDPLEGVTSVTLLLPPEAARNADYLLIEAKSARIELVRKDGVWVLPQSFDVPAEGGKVSALLDQLAALKRGLPIATSEAALKRFKVEDEDFERRVVLKSGDKGLATVYFGTSPGLRKSDARLAQDKAVYSVDLPTYQLPTDGGAWLSGELLQGDTQGLAEIDVAHGAAAGLVSGRLQLVRSHGTDKQPDTWADPGLTGQQHLDSARAESLFQQLQQLHVDAVLGTAAKPEWQQDRPTVALTLKDEKSRRVDWTLSKPPNDDFYVLKSSSQPWFFSISAAAGAQLLEASARDTLVPEPKKGPSTRK